MNEKIIDRLKKLIRHQRSAEKISSMNEAKVFADKIQELLDQYNLSMSDIDISEQVIDVDQELVQKCFKREWKRLLINKIAKLNSCQSIYDMPRMIIVGTEADRQIVFELYTYFAELGEHLYTFEAKRLREEEGEVPTKYKGSFMLGYAQTIANRLYQRHQAALANIPQTSTALIFIGDKLARSEQFMKHNIPTKETKMSMNVGSWGGYNAGVKAGKSVALTDETFEDKNKKQLP